MSTAFTNLERRRASAALFSGWRTITEVAEPAIAPAA